MNKNNTYRFAKKIIEITSIHEAVHRLCRDYCAEGEPEFAVETSQADIGFEREKSAREDAAEGIPIRQFTDAYLETLAVYRKIAEKMPEYDTVLMHGSAVALDGEAYLFTAKSGTGKSTHARLWREVFGERAVMVNDDKPLVKITDSGVTVYGTPWNGKHAFTSLTLRPSSENVEALLFLLLWQVKDEYRKSLSPVSWEQLEEKIYAEYDPLTDNGNADSRLRRIRSDGKALFDQYADNRSMRAMDCFLGSLRMLCMDCIEYLYHEGSETM